MRQLLHPSSREASGHRAPRGVARCIVRAAVLAGLLALAASGPPGVSADPAAPCRFVLGFRALHDQMPAVVGDCLEDERYDPASRSTLQRTTNGLLVWRLVDAVTAFTDGYQSWVVGPNGVQRRLNSERFSWERDPITTPPPPPQVVFFGDSHLRFWEVERAFASLRVANRGVPGQTSEEILGRFATDVAAAGPRAVVVCAGANDVFRGVPTAVTQTNLRLLLTRSRERGIAAFVATVPPVRAGTQTPSWSVADRNQRIRALNDWIRASAPEYGATVVDFYAALADDRGELALALATPDGIHLSAAGYDRLAQVLGPLLRQVAL